MYDENFDNHRLMYHPAAVAHWLETGRSRFPIYTEMELSTRCNHACIFCGAAHIVNNPPIEIDAEIAEKAVAQLHAMGSKSIMFSGHGEPLLHPDSLRIIKNASRLMSASLTTNGAALKPAKLSILDRLEWIRFSVNGCDPENYAQIHGATPDSFNKTISNIKAAVKYKKEKGAKVVIGAQMVLLEENCNCVVDAAQLFKRIGVDYFSVKPYSRHPLCENEIEISYDDKMHLDEELKKLDDRGFKTIFRACRMKKHGGRKSYDKCFGTNFINYVSADGNVWECNVFAGDERFLIGNIKKQSMEEIWNGPRRQKVLEFIENEMDIGKCRNNCRMNECNQYLQRLKNPMDHDNFI